MHREGTATTATIRGSFIPIASVAVILLGIALVPVLVVQIPPLVDYPNHLARMLILADGGQSPWLTQYYEVHWNFLPNLGMDMVVPPLTRLMSLETAGKVFIGLTFALLVGGVMALHAALHRRWSPWPLLAFFFLYNSVFLWGFLNYLFGLGLAFFSCAIWVMLRERSAILVVGLFSAIVTVLFFAHLFACGVFALVVLPYEFAQWWIRPSKSPSSLFPLGLKTFPIVVVPLVLLLLSPSFKNEPDNYPFWFREMEKPPIIDFSPLSAKSEALKGAIRTEHQTLDRITAVALMSLMGIGLAFGRCLIVPSMYLPLATVALAALAMPGSVGTTTLVDIRMPIVFLLVLIAGSDWTALQWRWVIPIAVIACTLYMIRISAITDHWRETDRHYRQFINQLDRLPEGAKLLSAIKLANFDAYSPAEGRIPESMPMVNLSCWGVTRRGLFVSNIFAAPGQQPIRLRPAVRHLLTMEEFLLGSKPIPWDRISVQYDYVVARRNQRLKPPVPAYFTLVSAGDEFEFYQTTGKQIVGVE